MVLACQLMCALSLLVPKTVSGLLRSGVVHQVLWISQNVDTYKESGSVVLRSPTEALLFLMLPPEKEAWLRPNSCPSSQVALTFLKWFTYPKDCAVAGDSYTFPYPGCARNCEQKGLPAGYVGSVLGQTSPTD
ncbi:hypothetical protein Y1Q_0013670 [Alligator mississippiensis]|uniref:Uncharacterized protein n=1 Tax=Alligator mississippiensis TaxID=8496 RepID=A0A151P3P8_ALLMI|nr:hypothetical protein Y1Q_0013670 [Alligator mississippiensis]